MRGPAGAHHTATFGTLQQPKFGKNYNILVNPLDIPVNRPCLLSYRQISLEGR
jgi:hypothetical protein